MRRLLIGLIPLGMYAQVFSFEPKDVAQGQVLKVFGEGGAQIARLKNRSIRLFPQTGGGSLGLMPIGVLMRPGTYTLEWFSEHDAPVHTAEITIRDAHYAKQNVVLTKALSELRSTSDERETVTAFLKEVSPERAWQEPFEAPIAGCITSPFGVTRLHNGKPTGDFHAGLDQRGAFGSSIRAVTGGTVKIIRPFTLRGGTVAIDHGQGLESIYLHMSGFAVKEGSRVKEGDVIGYVGSTGRSTGPHLHWTLYANGEPVNPLQWVHLDSCKAAMPKRRAKRRVR